MRYYVYGGYSGNSSRNGHNGGEKDIFSCCYPIDESQWSRDSTSIHSKVLYFTSFSSVACGIFIGRAVGTAHPAILVCFFFINEWATVNGRPFAVRLFSKSGECPRDFGLIGHRHWRLLVDLLCFDNKSRKALSIELLLVLRTPQESLKGPRSVCVLSELTIQFELM